MNKKITINGAEYTITDLGEVYGKSGKLINQRPNEDGYACFTAGVKENRTKIKTHSVVGKLFVPNPNNLPELDHLDSNRMNPSASNLEWVTHEENISRAYNKGHYKGRIVGTKNPKCNLTEQIVLDIRKDFDLGMTQKQISDKYNVPWSTVHNIITRQTWKHI